MRVALISDIHGNRCALAAVLEHIARQRVDAIWNLGDILSGPLEPAATADLLAPLALPTIRGNCERGLLACAERPGGASDQFAFAHTEPRHRDWLRGLPATLAPRADVLLCHGTPRSALAVMRPHRDVTHAYFQLRDPAPAVGRAIQLLKTARSRAREKR